MLSKRAHSVIRKALPHLGGEQEDQPARMPKKIALGGTAAIAGWQCHDVPNTKTEVDDVRRARLAC
jgi:hypothetical protein